MKIIRTSLLIAAIITANHFSKTAATPLSTASDMSVLLQAVEATTPLAASNAPLLGNFYSAQHAPGSASPWPPLPGNISDSPVWSLGDGLYLLDDLDVSYAKSLTGGMHAMDDAGPPLPGGGGEGTNEGGSFPIYTFPTNGLWLQVTNIANGQVYLNLMNATDSVYEILSKTDLTLTNWTIEPGEVWPTNTNAMPFTVNQAGRTNLFLWAADWTGVTENGNTTPDWWFWEYFGTTDLSDTNLDSTGENTLLYDYQNDLDPNVISFTVLLGNRHFNNANATGSYQVVGGVPAYEAVLVNDTNFNDAVWSNYDGALYLNLGPTDGVYQVWFGLKGYASNSQPTWIGTTVYLDRVAPTLLISHPATTLTAQPVLQLQGCAPESLMSVTFDLSNAVGVVTHQTGLLLGNQFFDTNQWEYTTDYFQCFDIPLTNGLNTITVHATDLAGNVTCTNFNFTLDYATATNPVVRLTWPQDGMQLCQSNFTLRGWTEDASATVLAQITDTNGDTNVVQGMVERTGVLWVENLPLAEGTNTVTLWVTNSAGLSSMTNFSVVKNDMTLTMNPVTDDLWLPTVSVSGDISDATATVWVNGVEGTNHGDGTWNAANVPVSPGGVASFDLSATPAGGGDPDASTNMDKDTELVIASAKWSSDSTYDLGSLPDEGWEVDHYQGSYTYGSGGSQTEHFEAQHTNQETYYTTDTTWDLAPDGSVADEFWSDSEGGAGAGDDPFSLAQEEGAFSASYATGMERYEAKNSEVKMALYTGGKGKVSNLFQLTATANEEYPINTNLLPEQITVGGQGLNASAIAYTTFPDGAPVDVTPQASAQYYNFTVGATKYLSYLEVFVCQPWPDMSYQPWTLTGDPPPFGWPIWSPEVNAGHAW